jgi:hypothetical protein
MTKPRKENMARVNRATEDLLKELSTLDVSAPGLSPYYFQYLERIKSSASFYCNIYRKHILFCLYENKKPLSELVFLDYGAGCGLLSILAKKSGFGEVICTDIYEQAVTDAEKLANYMGYPAHQYIPADAETLADSGIRADIVAGMDVIEHIYDLDSFLEALSQISIRPFFSCFGTGSNPHNPMVKKKLLKVMETLENKGSGSTLKERDNIQSYREMRKAIILENQPNLNGDALMQAIDETRGMRKDDIHLYLQASIMRETGRIKANTCDPLTGNWAERLLYKKEYQEYAEKHRFRMEWLPGLYNSRRPGWSSLLFRFINLLIRISGPLSRYIAPYSYIILKKNS